MGFINDAKANVAADAAKKARATGQRILVYKFIEANTSSKSTAPMKGMAEQIEAIEAEGWTLYNMAAAEGKAMTGERVALVCLFRPTA
ncbi:hypothetical protein ABZZ36_18345 [Actinacidiphila glaucinigra]|uniref:hypothetical protein n=1 Tax=Actinacidiphila glaucinigra TaxID=235986 RepID=UPI00339E24DE